VQLSFYIMFILIYIYLFYLVTFNRKLQYISLTISLYEINSYKTGFQLLKAFTWSTPVHVCIVNFARSASTRVRVVILSLIQLKTISNATSGICLSHNPLRRHFEALANWISIEGYSTAVSRRGNHNFLFLRLWSLLPLLLLGGCTATT